MHTTTILGASALAFLLACGGGSSTGGDTVETGGDDEDSEEGSDEEMPDEEGGEAAEDVASAPVQTTVEVRIAGEAKPVAIQIQDNAGETVAEGHGGGTFMLVPRDPYVVIVKVDDPHMMIGGGEIPVEVYGPESGTPLVVNVPVARVRLVVRRRGRTINNARVTLFREGTTDEVAEVRSGGRDFFPISPGRYEADVELGRDRIHVRGLTFMEDAQQDIPVDIQ